MKTKLVLAACCSLAASLPSSADTFMLKDGKSFEGKILTETPLDYVLEVQASKTIKTQRKVLKSEVAKHTPEQHDLKAFAVIEKFIPSPDFMVAPAYAAQITMTESFLKTFNLSPKFKPAKAILETLKSEQVLIKAGGMKVGGKIISPADYQANAYELDARVSEVAIRQMIVGENPLGALRLFADLDRDYPTTLAHGALRVAMKGVINDYTAEAKELLTTLPARLAERESALKGMAPEDQGPTKTAIEDEDAEFEAIYQSEKTAAQNWVTTSPFHKASLEDATRFGMAELTRLNGLKTEVGVEGGAAYRELFAAVNQGGTKAAVTAALTVAKTAQISARYLAPLEAAAKDLK